MSLAQHDLPLPTSAMHAPFSANADCLRVHVFAALALSHGGDTAQLNTQLEGHGAALRSLAAKGTAGAGACAVFVEALRERLGGNPLAALRGFEGAAAGADGYGVDYRWLAVAAWEQAALLAGECGLAAAAAHYRRLAAAGAGSGAGTGPDAEAGQQAERERILRAGSIGELGLSIAHEVNQPLAAISLHAAAARKWLRRPAPDIERALSSLLLISAAGRQAGDIVRSVQRLAARQDSEMGKVPVDQTIAETLQLLQRPLRKHGIEVDLALGLGECIIHANRVQLQQVVTNLLVNAIEAMAAGGKDPDRAGASEAARRIRVQTRHYNGDEVEISVADNGPGIAIQHRERVFGSLFSTKPNSTGMGLSISLAIVRAHGGHIAYEPGQPHGACFRFRLPVRPADGQSRLAAQDAR
jgi:signal transduction histidine kinase